MVYIKDWSHEDISALSDDGKEEIDDMASKRYLSIAFVQQSDKQRYGKLTEELENGFTNRNANYLRDVTKSYQLLNDNDAQHHLCHLAACVRYED